MTSPAFRAGNQNTNAGGTTVVITDPGTAGDFLIALLEADNSGATWTAPDGTWTQLFHDTISFDGATIDVWRKLSATGSGSYTFTSSVSTVLVGIVQAFSSVDAVGLINASGKQLDAVETADPWHVIGPALTITAADVLLVWCAAIDPTSSAGTESWTAPSGYTNKTESTNTFDSIAMASKAFTGPGTAPAADGTATLGGATNAARVGYHIALVGPSGPAITDQPDDTEQCSGLTASFNVTATTSGGTLHYQWKDDGANVGTDANNYTTGTLTMSDTGSAIRCDVTDDNGTRVSYAARLTVRQCPSTAWFRA